MIPWKYPVALVVAVAGAALGCYASGMHSSSLAALGGLIVGLGVAFGYFGGFHDGIRSVAKAAGERRRA